MAVNKSIRYANGVVEKLEFKVKIRMTVGNEEREIWAYLSKGKLPVKLLIGMDYTQGRVNIYMMKKPYRVIWPRESKVE